MRSWGRRAVVAALPALALGLVFQGSRGLWEPDEGRDASIALAMLQSGDWTVPRLNDAPYLDKPPLHFWTVAVGLQALGVNEWGARLPQALFFAWTAALLAGLGRRMGDERSGALAALVYATTLAPFVAANALTPDTPLAAFVVLAVYAYWRAEMEEGGRRARLGWWLAAGAAGGLGILTKGPAMLVFLPPLAAHYLWRRRQARSLFEPGPWLALGVALLLGLAWYVPIVRALPGAGAYLLDNQVTGRLLTAEYQRNPGWRGAVRTYGPTLAIGSLPWSLWWAVRGLRPRRPRPAPRDPATGLLVLWSFFPLAVFLLASSRLPLYLLPLAAPYALATGRAVARREAPGLWRRSSWAAIVLLVWCEVLVGLKLLAAALPDHRDSRRRAEWIASEAPPGPLAVLAIDTQLNGLSLYGYPELQWVRFLGSPYPFYTPLPTLAHVAPGLVESRRDLVAALPAGELGAAQRLLAGAGLHCAARPPADRLVLLVCPATASHPTAGRARRVDARRP